MHTHVQDESTTWSLHFTSERVGSLSIQRDGMARVYPATLHMLPTILETYKSHNHVNLVKAADIGQVIFVHAVPEGRDADEMLQQFAELEEAGELPVESDDGVTLPMLNARCALSVHWGFFVFFFWIRTHQQVGGTLPMLTVRGTS